MRDGETFVVECGPFKATLFHQDGELTFERLEFHSDALVGYLSFGEDRLPPELVAGIEAHADVELREQRDQIRAEMRGEL